MSVPATTDQQQRWIYALDGLCRVPGISHAVAISDDGLMIAASSQLPRDYAEQFSAATSGLCSLTFSLARLMGAGEVDQTIVNMAGGHVIVMTINHRAILAVLASTEADLAAVAYHMSEFVNSYGQVFVAGPRAL